MTRQVDQNTGMGEKYKQNVWKSERKRLFEKMSLDVSVIQKKRFIETWVSAKWLN